MAIYKRVCKAPATSKHFIKGAISLCLKKHQAPLNSSTACNQAGIAARPNLGAGARHLGIAQFQTPKGN
jgi:hypothetical protein